ncbi:MAG: endo-1,4-beta-xylanase, partial [Kiritimatiellaeota bacterium]|nr:endo-1,4-beta-xylanase [Kiritimatiellota bacterium]
MKKEIERKNVDLIQNSPWGMSSGAEDSGKYTGFTPMLAKAGVTWIRYFPEWDTIQPAKGKWNWKWADEFVKFNREHGIEVSGIFLYFARWASSDGGTRGFPVKDMKYWTDYVSACVKRYKKEITWWEIWNEGNSPAFNRHGSPKDYADMIRAAYKVGKAPNPNAKFG